MERDPLRTLPPRRDPPALRGEFADIEPHRLAALPVGIAPPIPRIRTEAIALKPTQASPAAIAAAESRERVELLQRKIEWGLHLAHVGSGKCSEAYRLFLRATVAANQLRLECERECVRVFDALAEMESA